ncbi:DUF2235 domain-containing protein [Aquabacterium sp.]|uniref:phospholipase effector Tle1 domain-containing protein n=1 Tax=Aquabacterium sp. TaxID=1872578 RepID=UPI002488A85B|nr:DUF2235 domain-containing protein [Aquabacterium sp.]MDI1260159.1 DUF2235 domain-containing protein [Aquabacterium sp.]
MNRHQKNQQKKWAACALLLLSLLGSNAHAAEVSSGTGGSCSPSTGGDPAKTCTGASNPINITNGNKYQREVDLAPLPGVLGLELIRHYNSAYSTPNNVNGILGRGWKLSYETELEAIGNSVQIIQADGERIIFGRSPLNRNLCSTLDPAQGNITVARTDRGDEYLWRLPSGRQLSFNAKGKLVQIRVPSGEFVSLQHDRLGHLVKVTDPQGRTLELSYLDPKERSSDPARPRFSGVQHIDTPVGRYSYQYGSPVPQGAKASALDVSANLTQVSLPASAGATRPSRQYLYDDARWPTLLTGIAVGPQRIATYAYNERGWAVRSEHGAAVDLLELERASLMERGRPGRVVLVHSKDAQHPQGQALEVLSAQVAGSYRITETRGVACPITLNCPAGNVRYDYDERGRTRQVTYFAAPSTTHTDKGWQVAALGQALRADKYEYDGLGRTTRHTEIRHALSASERIPKEIHYDGPSDRIALVRQPSVVSGQWHEVQTRYNEAGQVTQISERGWRPAVADAPAQAIERSTTYRYARINGRSVLAAIDGPLPGPADTTHYDWDARADHVVSVNYPQGLVHRYQRDEAGRIATETPPDGVSIAHTYLPTGQDATWQRGPAQVSVGYDALLRPSRIDLPDGEVRRFAYEGRSGAAAVATNTGQARWITPPTLPAAPMLSNPEIERLVQARPPEPWRGQQVVVDDFGALVALHTDTTGWEKRGYDLAGRLVERRLADATLWRWQRDALGRIVWHEVSRPGAASLRTTLSYAGTRLAAIEHPNESERYAHDSLGRVSARTLIRAKLSYTERFEYDAADRITAQYLPEGGTLRYTWGAGRQLKAIEHDDGRISAVLGQGVSQWLGWGRHTIIEPLAPPPASVAVAAKASSASSAPQALARVRQADQGYRWGNGVELHWQLDQNGQLSGMRYQASPAGSWQHALLSWIPSAQANAKADRPLVELAYGYDPQGRMSLREEDGARTSYGYDRLGQLLVAQGTADEVEYYAYDQGQMLGSKVKGASTDWREARTERNASGMPQSIASQQGSTRSLSYSADNRLIEVAEGGKLLGSYSHNTHGQRIGKTLGDGRTTAYLWQGEQLVGETQPGASGALARRYVYAHGVPVAVLDYRQGVSLQAEGDQNDGAWHQAKQWLQGAWRAITASSAELTCLHANEIGTPIAATNAQGQVIWRASYSAYGLVKAVSRPGSGSNGFELNLRLPGQYFDAETGWHDNGLRTYDPQRGQYLEPDPLGPLPNIKASLVAWTQGRTAQPLTQPFAYANHNPLIYADPSGLILFAFDGTNNSNPPPGVDDFSNVYKFYQAYDDGKKWYMNGVGRDDAESKIKTNWFDQYDANTAHARVDYMLNQIDAYMKDTKFTKGEEVNIDIVGFSRGSAMARDFANKVAQRLRDDAYKASGACVELRFLGLWDTVAQFGANGSDNGSWQLAIPSEVKNVFHAVAVNEHRYLFPGESIGQSVQRGFIGSHADIGGSYGTGDLSDVALNWIVEEAKLSGVKMFTWGDLGRKEWGTVTNPVVHDKNTDGGDRDFCLRVNNEKWADNCQKQSVANVGGLDTSQAKAFIALRAKPGMDADKESPITGDVDMEAYAKWLKENYQLDIAYQ